MASIFVSYAHVDNVVPEKYRQHTKGWVLDFVEELKIQLDRKPIRNGSYQIFTDGLMKGYDVVESKLKEQCEEADILLLVMSEGYLNSDWCKREREWFLQYVADYSGKVFLIELEPTERENWPDEFKGLQGYPFFELDNGNPVTLGEPSWSFVDPNIKYHTEVKRIAADIADRLKWLHFSGENDTFDYPTIFLADPTDDVRDDCEKVYQFLKKENVTILPISSFISDTEGFKKQVNNDIRRSHIFVQLLGKYTGRKTPEMPDGKPYYQYNLAKTISEESQLRIVQWRNSDLNLSEVQDNDHRNLLQHDTVRSEYIDQFIPYLKSVIKPLSSLPEPSSLYPTNNRRIIIIYNRNESVPLNITINLEVLGIDYFVQSPIGMELRQIVKKSNGVVIYSGADSNWAKNTSLHCRKWMISTDDENRPHGNNEYVVSDQENAIIIFRTNAFDPAQRNELSKIGEARQ
ncbi:MAG: toll/interleukin-1 receptor domain-containing protein [Deltaproteobacteria bacterium]|nr:toll/interleukin-1 receptor domain-containing protein [Deltaproteobacteria bacterium]